MDFKGCFLKTFFSEDLHVIPLFIPFFFFDLFLKRANFLKIISLGWGESLYGIGLFLLELEFEFDLIMFFLRIYFPPAEVLEAPFSGIIIFLFIFSFIFFVGNCIIFNLLLELLLSLVSYAFASFL